MAAIKTINAITYVLIWYLLTNWVESTYNALYRRTANISASNWDVKVKGQMKKESIQDCASSCLYQKVKSDLCNAFTYDNESQVCDIAKLDMMENPREGESPVHFYVDYQQAKHLKMVCRGGEHCCQADGGPMCSEGEGDCNQDTDCKGLLMCGNNNCLGGTSTWAGHAEGGMWDNEDDCCERRCTVDHSCVEGDGPCFLDEDCDNAGWAQCKFTCLNPQVFRPDEFPHNTLSFGYQAHDMCCHRSCNKYHYLCGLMEVGCRDDEDCSFGFKCNTVLPQPSCVPFCSADGFLCEEGGGHCETDLDCSNSGWLLCGKAICTNKTMFPEASFPDNVYVGSSEEQYNAALQYGVVPQGYYPTDNCCYRPCNVLYNVCQVEEVGCLEYEDCAQGLFCNTTLDQPRCEDINECEDNPYIDGQAYCTSNYVDCVNAIGHYNCTCRPGYYDHKEAVGCREMNECVYTSLVNGLAICGSNTLCTNLDTKGVLPWRDGFNCTCLPGYGEHKDNVGCRDYNECEGEYGGHNCTQINAKVCYNLPGSFTCKCEEGYSSHWYGDPNKEIGCLEKVEGKVCEGGVRGIWENKKTFPEYERAYGYVHSYGWNDYYGAYKPQRQCGFYWQVHPNSRLTLSAVSYSHTEECCDFVYITQDGYKTRKYSGYGSSNWPYMKSYQQGNNVHLRFQTDMYTNDRGFYLYWEISWGKSDDEKG